MRVYSQSCLDHPVTLTTSATLLPMGLTFSSLNFCKFLKKIFNQLQEQAFGTTSTTNTFSAISLKSLSVSEADTLQQDTAECRSVFCLPHENLSVFKLVLTRGKRTFGHRKTANSSNSKHSPCTTYDLFPLFFTLLSISGLTKFQKMMKASEIQS